MQKNNNYVRYNDALTDNEILLCAQIINKFKKNEIDFQTLKVLFLNHGIDIEAVPNDYHKRKITVDEAKAIEKRISDQKYNYDDIDYFILSSKDFNDVIFRMDYKAVEILANYGDPEYQRILISTLTFQLLHSYDKGEKLKLERSKWRRRINELRASLSKEQKNCNVLTLRKD